jgi:hypothetical protein
VVVQPAAGSVRAAVETISMIIGPTTLLTALAIWFGWVFITARANYLGLDPSTLGFSTVDYLLRSADAMYVPFIVILLAAVLCLTIHGLVSVFLVSRRNRGVVVTSAVAVAAGIAATIVGVRALFVPVPYISDPQRYLLPPVVLGGGVTLAVYAAWLLQTILRPDRSAPTSWERLIRIAVCLLVFLCTFWAATVYGTALGRGRGMDLERSLSSRPRVVVLSKKSLELGGHSSVLGKAATYRYRYSGLRLLVRSEKRYFIVPDRWSHEDGTVIVLDESPDIRIEFTPGETS